MLPATTSAPAGHLEQRMQVRILPSLHFVFPFISNSQQGPPIRDGAAAFHSKTLPVDAYANVRMDAGSTPATSTHQIAICDANQPR